MGGFNNEGYQQMNEKLNIEIGTTAAESLFSNGTVECHNLIVAEAMEKTLEDEKCEPEIALSWAVCAKNTLQNYFGHSPNELVVGFNINTPSVLTDQLPALEAATTSNMIRVNLNALHAARKSFMNVESSKKIRRALKSNVRIYADDWIVTGDSVYEWRQNCQKWRRPILGKEGQCVLIRYAGAFYRMHPCKGFGNPRNEEKKISSKEINEVLEEEDHHHHHVLPPARISLTLSLIFLYRPLLPVGLQGYILYQHRAVVYRF